MPFISTGGPGWHWQLSHDWLAERLHKARLYDQMTTPATGEEDE